MFLKSDTDLENWNILIKKEQVEEVLKASENRPQLVYKHSHTCGICQETKEKIEGSIDEIGQKADLNFVNVKRARPVSQAFADRLNVRHESPQVLLIYRGECIWSESHWHIKAEGILEALNDLQSSAA